MFKLKGSVEIRKIDSRDGKATQVIKQDNIVTDFTYLNLLGVNGNANFFGNSRISISESNATPDPATSLVPDIIATATPIAGNATWVDTADPPYGQLKGRINFVGFSRTFETVALSDLPAGDIQNTSANAEAYLLLTIPCTQGEFEFIDIFYRIQFLPVTGQGFLDPTLVRDDFGFHTFAGTGGVIRQSFFGISAIAGVPFAKSSQDYTSLHVFNSVNTNAFNYSQRTPFNQFTQVNYTGALIINSLYKIRYTGEVEREGLGDVSFGNGSVLGRTGNALNGMVMNTWMQGISADNTRPYGYKGFTEVNTSISELNEPFQTGFVHNSSSVIPFFDPDNIGTSQGKSFFSGAWTGILPEFYQILITGDGDTGVATYRFRTRKHLGFLNNTYTDRIIPAIYRNLEFIPNAGFHGWQEENTDLLRLSNTEIVQYDTTGVTLLNIFDGSYTHWDSTTAPVLNVTDVRQCAVDKTNRIIYVACNSTGLWIIDIDLATVTQQIAGQCYGVDVGYTDIAYALMSAGLFTSADGWAVALGFVAVAIADFIKADPESPNEQLAIVESGQVYWYEVGTNTTTVGYTGGEIKEFPSSLDVSDTGSFWATRTLKLDFGAATTTALLAAIASKSLTHSLYGLDDYYKVDFFEGNLICFNQLIDSSNTSVVTFNSLGAIAFQLHLDSGIAIIGANMRQLFTDNLFCWTDYEWNGVSWVEGDTSSKTTHLADEALINGINIRFEDGADPPQFVDTDFFTRGVNFGLLKDNATTVQFEAQWYTRPVIFDATDSQVIPGGAVVTLDAATSDPLFLGLENDSPNLHKFQIDGVDVAEVYTDGTPPALNEVAIAFNGEVTFNAGDVGKTFTANPYAYIRF